MRKSNWIIMGILLIASVLFLWLWAYLGFNLVDEFLDLAITIVWWVVIIGFCIAIHLSEVRRERSVRTTFIAPGVLYNSEAGLVRLDENEDYASALQKLLTGLNYNFKVAHVPEESRIRFKYIVRSDKFSNGGKSWEGEVVKVSNPDDVKNFSSKAELGELIDSKSAA